MISTKSIEQELQSIVGNQNLRAAVPGDVVCGVLPQFVAEPENERQLAAALAFANHAGIAVVPRGGGTKMDWGNPPKKAELVLSTARLNRILEHVWADLPVTVEAGCTLQSLRKTLAQHGQRLAFDGFGRNTQPSAASSPLMTPAHCACASARFATSSSASPSLSRMVRSPAAAAKW